MKAVHHLFATAPLAFMAYLVHGTPLFLLCLFVGIFIDADHSIDYYIKHRKFTWNAYDLTHIHDTDTYKLYLPFHSIEFTLLFHLIAYAAPIMFLPALCYQLHILMDMTIYGSETPRLFMAVRALEWFR